MALTFGQVEHLPEPVQPLLWKPSRNPEWSKGFCPNPRCGEFLAQRREDLCGDPDVIFEPESFFSNTNVYLLPGFRLNLRKGFFERLGSPQDNFRYRRRAVTGRAIIFPVGQLEAFDRIALRRVEVVPDVPLVLCPGRLKRSGRHARPCGWILALTDDALLRLDT